MNTKLSRIVDLANRLEQAIRHEGLQKGASYPTTEEIAKRMGVSTSAANGALRVLTKRGILDRRQRRGAVVSNVPGQSSLASPRRVHLLVHKEHLETEGLLADGVLVGIQAALPEAQLELDFIPAIDVAEYADRLVAQVLGSGESEGFVLVQAPLALQRLVQESGMPAVVLGSLHPSIDGMASIDRDHGQIADLAAEYLLHRGCARVVALFRSEMGPGDFVALDRLQHACQLGRLTLDDFRMRCLAADGAAVKQSVVELMGKADATIGFFCRSYPLAAGVAASARALGLVVGRDLHLVVADIYLKTGMAPPNLPHVRPRLSSEEIGQLVGRTLAQQARGGPAACAPEIIPVALVTTHGVHR